jgi:multiple sugar transport system permease protein
MTRKWILAGKYVVSLLLILMITLPLLVTVVSSFKIPGSLDTTSPLWVSYDQITFDNYRKVFKERYLLRAAINTLKIVAVSITINVLFGSLTAYCLERFQFRFKNLIYMLFYLAMMVPTNIVEIARFRVIRGLGLYNTIGAPIIIYIAANLMQLYIYRQFIGGIPVSLDESAMLDGCGYFRTFWQIIFPLLTPATATLIIIKTVSIVNDMYIPYLYMPKNQNKTLTTFLMRYAGAQQNSWPLLAAGIIVVALPTVLLYLFFQKYIIEGIAAGAVKE